MKFYREFTVGITSENKPVTEKFIESALYSYLDDDNNYKEHSKTQVSVIEVPM